MNHTSSPASDHAPGLARVRTFKTKCVHRMLALAACALLPPGSLHADTAYTENFSDEVPSAEWQGSNLTVSQATGSNTSWYLGQLNNDTVTLPLTGLDLGGGNATPNSQGQHSFVTVSYDLFVIGGWTGNNDNTPESAHTFTFGTSSSVDDPKKPLTTTFSNLPGQYQTFPYDSANDGYFSQPGGKGANQLNTLGFSGAESGYNDAVYQMAGGRNQSFTFDHNVDDLTLSFSAANLPSGATWGISNLKVTTGSIFTWQAAPSIGDGLDGGWDIGEHWANPNPGMSNSPGPDDAAEITATGNYNVSIHQDTAAGFFRVIASDSDGPSLQFNTIGHALTLTAGNYNNASLAVADGSGQPARLFVFNSNNDGDSDFNGVINAETLGIKTNGTLTLDGYLDPNQTAPGNVVLNVQREMNLNAATLNIRHGAILNGGLGGGSASSDHADGNVVGVYAYSDGNVNVDDQSVWNQTGTIWTGVTGTGEMNVSGGSQINIYQLPYAGQAPTIGGSLIISGFTGSSGSVAVKDPDSQVNTGQLYVGSQENDGLLTIDNFGVVNATSVSIGAPISDFSGISGSAAVNVTHQAQFNVTTPDGQGQLNVGDNFDGTLTVGFISGTDGSLFSTGQATADHAVIGNSAGVTGEVDVSYAQAANLHGLFTINKTLTVGAAGSGTLFMSGGGVSKVLGQGSAPGTIATIGDQAGSNGVVYFGGGAGGADWAQGSTFDASAGGVVLGNSGSGHLDISIGGQGFVGSLVMAQQAGSTADVSIDGNGSDNVHTTLLKVSDATTGLAVGQAGTSASVNVANGGLLDTFHAMVGGQGGNTGPGTVTVQDLRDPATVTNHVIGSLWLVHGQSLGGSSNGGTLDIGGEGLGGQHGGSGSVTLGAGGQLGVDVALQLGANGQLDVTGGSVTVGTTDSLFMDATPNRLHVVGNTTLPGAKSTVSGMGVITADVLVDSGGNLGPNGSTGSQTGTLSIVGSLHELSGANLSTHISAASSGNYDTFALRDASLTNPTGTATLINGAGVTLIGQGSYSSPQIGDHVDVVTAANVIIGTLNLSFVNLPSSGWHYGVVSIPGGQALRIQYGTTVQEPNSQSIGGTVRLNGLPLAGILIQVSPGISALTDANGVYLVSTPSNSSGTVTPGGPGYTFSPATRSFTNLNVNLTAQDFLTTDNLEPVLSVTVESGTGQGTIRRVTWFGISGLTYRQQTSTNLVDWTDVGAPLPGADASLSFTYGSTPDPKRFFRVRSER